MKETIKRLFAINSHTNASLYKVLSYKSLTDMRIICAEAAKDDSIADVSWLRQFRTDVDNGNKRFYTTDCNFSNSHIYGIWNGLFGSFGQNPVYTPSIEHGLILHDQIFNDLEDTARAACATFGLFRKQIIRKYTDIPVFCVGPYIHYAEPFYDRQKLEREKEKNGHTLLVFPMHSTDTSKLSVEIENYRSYLRKKQDEFDTILINTFWWTLNDPLTQALEADGYRIVSAGFRDDIMFMSRLKTLIQMADLVVGDSVGTHIGYCVHCGVPFSYEELGSSIVIDAGKKENKDIDFCQSQIKRISKVFDHATTITDAQIDICRYYWGEDMIRTPDEIHEIAGITEEIMKRSHGWERKMNWAANSVLNDLPVERRYLLQDALA